MLPEQREVLDESIVKMRAGRMTRRTFIERTVAIGLTTSVAASLLDACGGSSGGGVTNIVWTSENDTTGTYAKMADTYNKTNKDNVHVTWENGPTQTDQFLAKYTNMLRARSHSIDVMSIDVVYPAEFASNGWTMQLDSKWPASARSGYLQGPIQACIYNGHIWAVPFRTDVGLIYYRTDLVTTPPNTWDELTTMAQQLQSSGKVKYGYVWQGAQYEGLVCDFNEVVHGYGGNVLDPNNPKSVVVNSPEVTTALTKMVGWVGTISPTAVTNYIEDDARGVWQNGDSAFMRNWPYAIALGNASGSKVAGKFDIHPMLYGGSNTTGHSTTGGWNLAINAFSPYGDACWSFINYMLGPSVQALAATGASWTPTLISVYSNPAVLKAVPYFSKITPVLQTALPRPVSAQYPDLSAAIQLRVHQALLKQSSVSDSLTALQSDLQKLVG